MSESNILLLQIWLETTLSQVIGFSRKTGFQVANSAENNFSSLIDVSFQIFIWVGHPINLIAHN